MTTVHDEEELQDLLSWCNLKETMRECAERCAKEYAEHIRLKTIDEAIGCVPPEEIKRLLLIGAQIGFDNSGEGYNGEYTRSSVTPDMIKEDLEEAIGEWLKSETNLEQLKK